MTLGLKLVWLPSPSWNVGNSLTRVGRSTNLLTIRQGRNEGLPRFPLEPIRVWWEPPTDILCNFKTSKKTYSMAASLSRSNHYKRRNAHPPLIDVYRYWIYRTNKKNRFQQQSDVPGLTVSRPFNKLFTNALDYGTYRILKKFALDDDDVANELYNLTKMTAVHMKGWTFSC